MGYDFYIVTLIKLIVQQMCQEIVYLLFLVKSESKIYHTTMAAKLLIPRNTRKGMHTIKNVKLILLSFHDRFLNFKENMGISATNNHENRQTTIKR